MKRALILAVLLLITGCGRQVEYGTVTGHDYRPSRTWYMPQTIYCGKDCTMTIMTPQTDPEEWLIEVTEQPPCREDGCKSQWLHASPSVQAQFPIGSTWDQRGR